MLRFVCANNDFSGTLTGYDFLDLFVLLHVQPAALQAPKQSRHPERSASRIYRKQRALWRGVEGPRRCLLADALGAFRPQTAPEDKKVTGSEDDDFVGV
jgi:hypothetical protein